MADEWVPSIEFVNMPDGSLRAQETMEAMMRDILNAHSAARDERVKTVLRELGWFAPEDIAAHDRTERAAERARCVAILDEHIAKLDKCAQTMDVLAETFRVTVVRERMAGGE